MRLRILTTTLLAQAHYHRGEYERVVELATDRIAVLPADGVYEHFGNVAPASVLDRLYLGLTLAELGRFAEAAAYAAAAIRLAEPTHHAFSVGRTLEGIIRRPTFVQLSPASPHLHVIVPIVRPDARSIAPGHVSLFGHCRLGAEALQQRDGLRRCRLPPARTGARRPPHGRAHAPGGVPARSGRAGGRRRPVPIRGGRVPGEEDQFGCAWIAGGLIEAGYEPQGWMAGIVARWRGAPVAAVAAGSSGGYLRESGQIAELRFVLDHVDDVDATFQLDGHRLVMRRRGDDQGRGETRSA